MSERMDNIVNELTNYIEEQMQTEVEMALGVKHRKDVDVPMFGCLCFICKDGGSANILVNYLQNNMGFNLTYKDCSCYSLTSKSNERINVWAIGDFEKMRGYRYQAIFIQDDIYSHALANKVSMHALYVNELIPPMEPWVFRLPNPIAKIKTKPLPTKTVFEER